MKKTIIFNTRADGERRYTQQSRLLHPISGEQSFGIVPYIKSGHIELPSGHIYLPYGRRNFGAVHIFERHSKEMLQQGLSSLEDVPSFVAKIVRPRAPLHLEGGEHRDHKLAVVQSSSGTVILQLRLPQDTEPVYTVVTAFLGKLRHGPRVGVVK